ncbi:MAG TPA: DUF1330 domain-containing protein [Saprospiraceae bacterium]|nr:DUF1330 domain-containing protein [Saprospiraceae bacterium]
MIFITQLIYIRPGQEAVFDQFESVAIPLISKYGGRLLLRLRPDPNSIVESSIEMPYEVHLVTFENESDFARFMQDEERKQFLHLKEASIRSAILVKGQQL